VKVNFAEPVTVTGTPRITLNTAPNAVVDYSSGSGTSTLTFNYTVQAGDTQASALDYLNTGALALNGGTIKDAATNNATLTLPAVNGGSSLQNSKTITIDTTAPTVGSVTSTTANGSYNAGSVVAVKVNFAEPVTVTGTPRITLNTAPNAVVDYSSGSGTSSLTFNYTVQAGDTQASALDYLNTGALALNGGTIKDVALNNATLTLPAVNGGSSLQNSKTITIDTTAPSNAVSLNSASGAYFAGGKLFYKGDAAGSFTLDDAVTDAGGSGPTSATYPAIGTTDWTHGAETIGTGPSYTSSSFSWTANPAANPSAYSVTGTDIAGNSASTSIAFVSDTTAPASGALTIGGFSNSLTVSPNVTALYAETASATAAGLKATGGNALTRTQASPSSAGVCPAAGSITGSPATTDGDVTATGAISDT